MLAIFAGADTTRIDVRSIASWLLDRWPLRTRTIAVSYGLLPFLEAGLLDGGTAVAPWDAVEDWSRRYSHVQFESRLFELGGPVWHSVGRASTIDFALSLLGWREGAIVATRIADRLNWSRLRKPDEAQKKDGDLPAMSDSRALRFSLQLMRRRVEHPLSPSEVARQAGIHPRQLQRLFWQKIGTTPCRFCTKLRLQHARHLLQTTNMKVVEVAKRTGFVSASHFTLRYKQAFGIGPRQDRPGLTAAHNFFATSARETRY
jgi:transcriptional regulator GlxA family with amidase domain